MFLKLLFQLKFGFQKFSNVKLAYSRYFGGNLYCFELNSV